MSVHGFRRVAVLMGGPSSEREISLQSGRAVAQGLREDGFEVVETDVQGRDVAVQDGVEAVFIAMHGEFGEDGELQALLDERGIPYTGSGAAASRAAMDKGISKQRFVEAGIPTPAYEPVANGMPRRLAFPVVVKPRCEGSSFGVFRVDDAREWDAAAAEARRYGPDLIVEAYVPGRELTVGIVGDDALPVIEIAAPGEWYDFDAKYTYAKGRTEYRVPAPLPEAVAARCRAVALDTFRALGCRGFARVDFRLAGDGTPCVLELNSIPGFTEHSLLPKAAEAAGMSFASLCGRIMDMAAYGES